MAYDSDSAMESFGEEDAQTTTTTATTTTTTSCTTGNSSALRSSIAKYGNTSYYYAHSRPTDPPPHAKVVAGPGLVTGGPPVLLSSSLTKNHHESTTASSPPSSPSPILFTSATTTAAPDIPQPIQQRRVEVLRKYSWCDNKKNVKVYILMEHLPAYCQKLVTEGSGDISVNYEDRQTILRIQPKEQIHKATNAASISDDLLAVVFDDDDGGDDGRRKCPSPPPPDIEAYELRLCQLNEKVLPVQCGHSVSKSKITITLAKKDCDMTWYKLLKDQAY
eukprot:GHVS01050551.1.p1 GENE.GHVS01050551.1~~GHVS01050551.1.p1  ORF type:complete len:277 (+),score=68.58 GHVS01050551.1:142-972(+)